MPDARTHDMITLVTGAALVPVVYVAQVQYLNIAPPDAGTNTAWLLFAHMISGILFSPDLDLDSQIDNRWGIFYWIWRPYMWAVPHRNFWSHSLIFAPLLRLAYFYFVVLGLFLGTAWLFSQVGIVVPTFYDQLTIGLREVLRDNPDPTLAFLVGFCTGSAAHTIADWLVTEGKRFLRMFGIRITRDYRNHDRYIPRQRRAARRS